MQNKIKKEILSFFYNKKLLTYIFFGLNILFIDRITKYFALYFHEVYFASFQRILHLPPILNYGMTFNLFFFSDAFYMFLFRFIGIGITVYFFQRAMKKYKKGKTIFAEVAIVAGAFSNLIDRFYYTFVIDFIFFTFPFTNYVAIANFADFAITLGCIYLICDILVEDITYYQ